MGNVNRCSEYETIFEQYSVLVDQLISSHMTDLGISEKQFAKACEMADGVLANKIKRLLFEELWAAENYDVFVRLMAKRNVELQLEALEVLAHRYGLVYDMFVPIGASSKSYLSEDHLIKEAILRSLREEVENEFDDVQLNIRNVSTEDKDDGADRPDEEENKQTVPVDVELNIEEQVDEEQPQEIMDKDTGLYLV